RTSRASSRAPWYRWIAVRACAAQRHTRRWPALTSPMWPWISSTATCASRTPPRWSRAAARARPRHDRAAPLPRGDSAGPREWSRNARHLAHHQPALAPRQHAIARAHACPREAGQELGGRAGLGLRAVLHACCPRDRAAELARVVVLPELGRAHRAVQLG